jgi:hypothetical protein
MGIPLLGGKQMVIWHKSGFHYQYETSIRGLNTCILKLTHYNWPFYPIADGDIWAEY